MDKINEKDYVGYYVKQYLLRDCRTLNQYGFDWGLSCGTYGLRLRNGICIKFLKMYFPLLSYDLYFYAKSDFNTMMYVGTTYCSAPTKIERIWNECINIIGEEKFSQYEYEFVIDEFYNPLLNEIDFEITSRPLQECLFSWTLDKGYKQVSKYLNKLIDEIRNKTITEQINILYDFRYKVYPIERYSKSQSSERFALLQITNINPL